MKNINFRTKGSESFQMLIDRTASDIAATWKRNFCSFIFAKNAALAILSAAIMTDETILIENLPDVRDINVLLEAIAGIGAQVDRINKSTVKINGSTIGDVSVDDEN